MAKNIIYCQWIEWQIFPFADKINKLPEKNETSHKQKNTWGEEDVRISAWDLKRQYKVSNFGTQGRDPLVSQANSFLTCNICMEKGDLLVITCSFVGCGLLPLVAIGCCSVWLHCFFFFLPHLTCWRLCWKKEAREFKEGRKETRIHLKHYFWVQRPFCGRGNFFLKPMWIVVAPRQGVKIY